jgi:RHS repeat-associated protein
MSETKMIEQKKRRMTRHNLIPLWLRCVTTFLLPIFGATSLPSYCWAAVEIQLEQTPAPTPKAASAPVAGTTRDKANPKAKPPPPPLPPNLRAAERSDVSGETPKSGPQFSKNPTDQELFECNILAEPLVPIGGGSEPKANRALAAALLGQSARSREKVSLDHNVTPGSRLREFLSRFPTSHWRAAVLLNLGLMERQSGYYSRALISFEEAWKLSQNATGPRAQALANRALGEVAELNSRLGRRERLETLFQELDNSKRKLTGTVTEKIGRARQGVWLMQHRPEKAYRCGPMALERVLAHGSQNAGMQPAIFDSESTDNGMNLTQVWKLSQNVKGMPALQMARRSPGAPGDFPVPAVVHWKAGHYAALVEKNSQGLYLAEDPTFGDQIWVTRAALEEESSGYFLVKSGPLPGGWTEVTETQGDKVWGKGNVGGQNPNRTGCNDTKVVSGKGCQNCNQGMPGYDVHAMTVSLSISDTPMSYKPPLGPQMAFSVFYAQREANQPSTFQFWNLGPKWTANWLSYILDYGYYTYDVVEGGVTAEYYHQASTNPSAYLQGGGLEGYSTSSFVPQDPAHPVYQYQYGPATESRARLVQQTDEGSAYKRFLPDGSEQHFEISTPVSNSPGQPHRVFLTKDIDPQGNVILYGYDGGYRLVTVRDAANNITTLQYEDPADTKRLTSVTDPFGRIARLHYNAQGQLDSVTDVMDLTSTFHYAESDFIDSMTTPYGTYLFSRGDSTTDPTLGTTRWLEATDPMGNTERTEFNNGSAGIPDNEPAVPAGMPVTNSYLVWRNSFYWDKAAYAGAKRADGTFDYTKARLYHWLHDADMNTASGILESTKQPLESRVWYFYEGQSAPHVVSANMTGSPTHIGRVLDDGSTQLSLSTYNPNGRVLTTTDPMGRITKFDYAPNNTDLIAVRRLGTGGSPLNEIVMQAEYNGQHQPNKITDAAGQDTILHYKANGQPDYITNARDETVSFHYTSDYLDEITGPVAGDNIILGYDTKGRVNQVTNSDDYTVTTSYDDLNRLLTATYPDGTFSQVVYDRLHTSWSQDREGQWTQFLVNPLRQVEVVHDPKGGTVQYDWCGCGKLMSLTDGNFHTTSWVPDAAGRTAFRKGPDGFWTTYVYENTTSRIKSIVDAKNQVTNFTYNPDNSLAGVSYSNAQVATPAVSYAYDPQRGRLTSMTDGTGITSYTYHPLGVLGADNVQTVQGPLADSTITLGYDELGRLNSRSINGVAQALVRDALGRVTSITNALGAFTYQYDGVSRRVTEVDGPNGRKTLFSYFDVLSDLRLQQIKNLAPDGSVLSQFDYQFDAGGRISNWTRQLGTQSDQYGFGYDALGQLTHAIQTSGANTLSKSDYSYDDAGNRISVQFGDALTNTLSDQTNAPISTQSGGPVRFAGQLSKPATVTVNGAAATVDNRNRFEAKVNLSPGSQTVPVVATDPSDNSTVTHNYQVNVTAGSPRNYTRDNNGNITSSSSPDGSGAPNATYEWDAADRLSAINMGTHRSEIYYDGLGRRIRVAEKDSGIIISEKRFLWVGNELCEERDASGSSVTKHFYRQGEQRIGGGDAGVYLYTRDHLGSIREMTDSGGNVRARYEYDVWGRRSKVVGDLSCDFGFTGHYVHEPSALHMALYRAYDAVLGRWINRDPIREAGGLNLYAYVGSNPANFTDPLGLLVEVYYENIGPSGGGSGRTAAWIFGGQHSYVHIQTPSIDVTVELEGPHEGRPYGNITIRDFDPGRGGRKRGVKRPCPEGDYSFEHNLLDEFSKYFDDPLRLPDYVGVGILGPSQNSNTFANHLVTSQGGSINDIPTMAVGSGDPFTPDRAFRLETTAPEVISRNAFGPLGF